MKHTAKRVSKFSLFDFWYLLLGALAN